MTLPYYPRYTQAFLQATTGWPLELKGAYAVLLDLIYLNNDRLPDDPQYIAGNLGCSVRKWNQIRATLIRRGKIGSDGGFVVAVELTAWRSKERSRPSIPAEVLALVSSLPQVCTYCGNSTGPFEWDHIVPWSKGGRHDPHNLTIACRSCNRSKGAKTIEQWFGVAQ